MQFGINRMKEFESNRVDNDMVEVLRKNKYHLSVHHLKDKGLLFLDFELSIRRKLEKLSMLYYLDLTQAANSSYRISHLAYQPFYLSEKQIFNFNNELFYLREMPIAPDIFDKLKTTPAKEFVLEENLQTHCIYKVNHSIIENTLVDMSCSPISNCQFDPVSYAESKYGADSIISMKLLHIRMGAVSKEEDNLRKQLKVKYSSFYFFMDAPLNSKIVFINGKWRLLNISCDILNE